MGLRKISAEELELLAKDSRNMDANRLRRMGLQADPRLVKKLSKLPTRGNKN